MVDTQAPAPSFANSVNDSPASDDKTFAAYAFLNDLPKNADMKSEWSDTLDKVKAKMTPADGSPPSADVAKQGLEVLDNVIAEWGYDATAVDVLGILKTPFWQNYQALRKPNAQSDRFVQDLMSDPTLSAEWSEKTGAISGADTSPLDAYLKTKGYDCNAQQVSASFDKMRNHNLNYWTGVYANTVLTLISSSTDSQPAAGGASASSATPIQGPALTIYGSQSVGIGMLHVMDFSYASGQLTWNFGSDDIGSNKTQASITFSQLSQPRQDDPDKYVGDVFSGTLTLKEPWWPSPTPGASDADRAAQTLQPGTYSFSGKVGSAPAAAKPARIPPSVNKPQVDSMHEFLSQVLFYGGLAMMAHFVLEKTGISGKISEKLESLKSKARENSESMKKNFEEGQGGDLDLANSTTTQRQIDQMKANGASAEEIAKAENAGKAEDAETDAEDEAEGEAETAKTEDDLGDVTDAAAEGEVIG